MSTPHPFGSSSEPLPPELEARLRLAVEAELDKPVRPWGREAVIFVVVTVALFCFGSVFFDPSRSPLEISGPIWGQSLALLAVALIAGGAGLAPWPQRTSRPLILGSLVGGAVLVTQVFSMELSTFTPHVGCFAWELVCSLVPAGIALVAARQHAPRLAPRWSLRSNP
jgi:hypothetical protein